MNSAWTVTALLQNAWKQQQQQQQKRKKENKKEEKNETWRLNADAAKAESKQAHNIYKFERRPDGNIHLF